MHTLSHMLRIFISFLLLSKKYALEGGGVEFLTVCQQKLVNKVDTKPFKLGSSKLVCRLFVVRRRTILIFKVKGQRSRSFYKN